MNDSILLKYYSGILSQLNAEVQKVNSLFEHQGLKGAGNEEALVGLLKKFIPKKYGVSSGIVIDSEGNQSKQCDIIIYDNYNFPEILSLSYSKFFPVDLVLAVIEVKTSLDSKKAEIALENIDSVKKLKYIQKGVRLQPTEPDIEITGDSILWDVKDTSSPIGVIFSYESETKNFKTFWKWFNKEHSSI